MFVANASQIRQADQIQINEKKVPGCILMEMASLKATHALLDEYPEQHAFLFLVGPGNNGGDGLAMARMLHLKGKEIQVILAQETTRFKGDAQLNYNILAELPVPLILFGEETIEGIIGSFSQPPIIVDSLLGTGIQDEIREPVSSIIRSFKKQNLPTVAIDLPSGLNASSGQVINQVLEADLTLTFQLPKVCHAVYPAKGYCGKVEVLDIGIWPEVVETLAIKRKWLTHKWLESQIEARPADGHKGTFGHLLVVGGSSNMAGAIALTAYAGMRAGSGLLSVLCPESCKQTVLNLCPEVMCQGAKGDHLSTPHAYAFDQVQKGKDAVVIGPGMGQNEESYAFLKAILPMIQVPLVLDADALNILAEYDDLWAFLPDQTVLTPHPGEMKRLMGLDNVNQRRLESAERLAQDREVCVVLKGAGTIISTPDGHSFINSNGNPGMATAGSGDVLTGIIGSILGQGYEMGIAASMGVFLHGRAGDRAAAVRGMSSMIARDLIDHLFVDKM
ncbi:MAG: NAD(P)H-hydrate dehydratase [Bacteroidota bacterium]